MALVYQKWGQIGNNFGFRNEKHCSISFSQRNSKRQPLCRKTSRVTQVFEMVLLDIGPSYMGRSQQHFITEGFVWSCSPSPCLPTFTADVTPAVRLTGMSTGRQGLVKQCFTSCAASYRTSLCEGEWVNQAWDSKRKEWIFVDVEKKSYWSRGGFSHI